MRYRFSAAVLAVLLIVGGAANASAQSEIGVQVLARINQARAAEGLPELTRNAQLDAAAQAHADDLSRNGVSLGHRGSDGSTFKDRIARAGYGGETTGENWAAYRTLDQIMTFWLKDPPHRQNILRAKFREIGIGVAQRTSGGLIVITDFGVQAGAPEISAAPAPGKNAPQKPRIAPTPARPAAPKPTRAPTRKPTAKPLPAQPDSLPTAPTDEPAHVALANVPQAQAASAAPLQPRGRIAKSVLRAIASGTAGIQNRAGDPLRMTLGALLASGGMILLGIAAVGHWRFRMR